MECKPFYATYNLSFYENWENDFDDDVYSIGERMEKLFRNLL